MGRWLHQGRGCLACLPTLPCAPTRHLCGSPAPHHAQEFEIPFGACVWATGVAMHPIVKVLQDKLPEGTQVRWAALGWSREGRLEARVWGTQLLPGTAWRQQGLGPVVATPAPTPPRALFQPTQCRGTSAAR